MALNSQHKRVSKNRVSITYDVETNGASEKKELPFVSAVLGNFSGGKEDPRDVEDREFIQVDQDNFNDVLSRIGPELSLKVDNVIESALCKMSFSNFSKSRERSALLNNSFN